MKSILRRLSRRFHRRIVYPAALALRGEREMYPALRRLRSLQWSSPEELAKRQEHRLAESLNFAGDTVAWYRERWNVDLPVCAAEAVSVLRVLPFLTKRELQQMPDELLSDRRPPRQSRKTTGGSTGRPVSVAKNPEAMAWERAASWLAYGWFGVRIGDRGARFWGSPTDLGARRIRFAVADLVMNRMRFSAFAFGEEKLEEYWRHCLRRRPDYFYGYVSMLTEFARHLEEEGHDGRRLDLDAVICTAEALTSPERELLRETFGAPVQNEYGCGEVGPIAYECPQGRLHVMSENVLIEILDERGNPAPVGESGEVVVTDLRNRAMPLIRYRVGDRAVAGKRCPCGRGFPVLREVRGRAYDFVRDGAGRRYHGEYFMYIFEDLRDRGAEIGQFRVVQKDEEHLSLEVSGTDGLNPKTETYLLERIHRDMPEMEVVLKYVDEIERLESGKTKIIHNEWIGNGPRSRS